MHPRSPRFRWLSLVFAGMLVVGAAAVMYARRSGSEQPTPTDHRQSTFAVSKRDFVRAVRLNGTVEAVQSTTISVPRLSGPNTNSLVITTLVQPGSTIHAGDLIVEFDRQDQIKNALDRRAELQDLEQQIRKREAEETAARAKDDGEISQGESSLTRAQLEMAKNEMLPKIYAEKNALALEQAEAMLKQLKATYDLKRQAAAADIRMLHIRRDRAENAMRQAEGNAQRMSIKSPIGGMAVLKTIWKGNTMAEVQEGEEVRAGVPVVDIVNPNAMRVRARANQADVYDLRIGQAVRIGLDAYPDLSFSGRIAQISPLGGTSTLSPKVRTFIVLIDVNGSHPNLMPDLTASLDVELSRVSQRIVVPRDSVRTDGKRAVVRVQRGSGFQDREVTIEAVNACEALIGSGLPEGAVIARNIAAPAGAVASGK